MRWRRVLGPSIMGAVAPPHRAKDTDWLELVVTCGAAVGLNATRLRWKLLQLRQRLQKTRRGAQVSADRVRYVHKTCPSCSAVSDRTANVCAVCGARLRSRPFELLARLGVVMPLTVSITSLLGLAMIGIYVRMVVAEHDGLFGFTVPALLRFGGHYPPLVWAGEWWRLMTAMFLHIGVWHLGFNVLALSQIGPPIEQIYGRSRMLLFFMLTGVLANLGSEAAGLRVVSAGASGGLMGLIGVAAGWGHREGTTVGRAVRNGMLRWGAYTMVFGFLVGADNAAHGFGFAAGAVLGYLARPSLGRLPAARPLWIAAGFIGVAAAGTAVALAFFPPRETKAAPMITAGEVREIVLNAQAACRARGPQSGPAPGSQPADALEDDAAYDPCGQLTTWREQCRALRERQLTRAARGATTDRSGRQQLLFHLCQILAED
jgi:rhomboid protease GluP